MGCCVGSNIVIVDETINKFIKYNIIDKQNNIIVGIYRNSSEKSNIIINQGIYIGKYNKIYQIKFAILHNIKNKYIELFFENNIKLVLIKYNKSKIKMFLYTSENKIDKFININKYKKINNNSEYIDLISNLI